MKGVPGLVRFKEVLLVPWLFNFLLDDVDQLLVVRGLHGFLGDSFFDREMHGSACHAFLQIPSSGQLRHDVNLRCHAQPTRCFALASARSAQAATPSSIGQPPSSGRRTNP
jgi:hypothetical protein